MANVRQRIREELAAMQPFDALEERHLADALAWVDSGAEIWRIAKPDTPPKHLVCYFAVIDGDHILLVDHRNAGLWLPTGGHVDPGEHPRDAVVRELAEELALASKHAIEAPVMISCTETVGETAGHVDVSLWYVVRESRDTVLRFDEGEFKGERWFAFDEIPCARSDPHMRRFVEKLRLEYGVESLNNVAD